jgi:hypothetical protein
VSYTLQAVIGRNPSLPEASTGLAAIKLSEDLWMVPLSTEVRDRHGIPLLPFDEGDSDEVPDSLRSLCRQLSQQCMVAYVEAAFFGGVGSQASAIFKDGTGIGPPVTADHAINQALKLLGVTARTGHDEFDTVGLGRHRNTDDWLIKEQTTT